MLYHNNCLAFQCHKCMSESLVSWYLCIFCNDMMFIMYQICKKVFEQWIDSKDIVFVMQSPKPICLNNFLKY